MLAGGTYTVGNRWIEPASMLQTAELTAQLLTDVQTLAGKFAILINVRNSSDIG